MPRKTDDFVEVHCRKCDELLGEVLRGAEVCCNKCSLNKKVLVFTKAGEVYAKKGRR